MSAEKRVAIVTGAGSGIGEGISLALGAAGHMVVCLDISEAGKDVAGAIEKVGGSAEFREVDVVEQDQVEKFTNQIVESFGRIDILVNCAGIRPTHPFPEMKAKDWDRVLKVNLYGTYNLCAAALPVMARGGWGRVVNISSLAAQQGSTGGHSHYAAAKAGIMGFSKSLAREYAGKGITVNVLAPGWIDTPGWGGELDGKRDEYATRVPVGRLGTPMDVANAVCFLVAEDASYITGVTLPINGGLYMS